MQKNCVHKLLTLKHRVPFSTPKKLFQMDVASQLTIPDEKIITEGCATIKTLGNVFYNPVQEFNRDLRFNMTSYLFF